TAIDDSRGNSRAAAGSHRRQAEAHHYAGGTVEGETHSPEPGRPKDRAQPAGVPLRTVGPAEALSVSPGGPAGSSGGRPARRLREGGAADGLGWLGHQPAPWTLDRAWPSVSLGHRASR